MSSNEGSCARTRGWNREFKKLQRFTINTSSSGSDMSFDLDAGKSDESSGEGRLPQQEREPPAMEKQLRNLRVSSKVSRLVEEKSNEAPAPREGNARGKHDAGVKKDRTVPEGMKDRPGKYKDEQKRKEKDHGKELKSKDKDKQSEKDRKEHKRKNESSEKKSHDRHKKSDKPQKEIKDYENDGRRKDKHRGENNSERDHTRGSRYEDQVEHSDRDFRHRDRHHESSKHNYNKSSSKSERERETKRSRHEGEQRSTNKSVRSPSPSHKEKDEKDRSGRDRVEKDSSGRDRVEKDSSGRDRVEKDSSGRDRVEKDSSGRDRVEKDSSGRDRVEKDSSGRDRVEKDSSGREWVEKDSSGRYRRSGLGGYSPRRRRSEAAIKTPSPPPRSPERKKARAWDLPPAGMDSGVAAAMAAAHQAAAQQAVALASVSSLTTVSPALATVSLTQATRNLRRLYIGNIPSTVSEGELTEFINAAMLSVNANHIPGTKPCINCMVNVEKSYAFAEFLTAEDATAGLAFDGITLHGTTLKIRRPRDYVPPLSGGLEYASAVDMVSSVVPDSPHKIFVGGICKTLSADKVKEIVTAFGQLKAYHWEELVENNHKEAFAFFEYLDPSITLKACAGLNGMRLGNKIITVIQATPNATVEVVKYDNPFYGIPELAKTLLQTPTRVLEFQNVISEEEAVTLSEAELLEIEEDICLECKRFGTVKSTHVVKPEAIIHNRVTGEVACDDHTGNRILEAANNNAYATEEEKNFAQYIASVESHFLNGVSGIGEANQTNQEAGTSKVQSWVHEAGQSAISTRDEQTAQAIDSRESMEVTGGVNGNMESSSASLLVEAQVSVVEDGNEGAVQQESETNSGKPGPEGMEIDDDTKDAYPEEGNLGRVYVEFTREETACQAAHVLHGRLYGERKVMVSYFPVKLYQKRYGKGVEPRTHEEKQALALAAQEHLNTYLPDRD